MPAFRNNRGVAWAERAAVSGDPIPWSLLAISAPRLAFAVVSLGLLIVAHPLLAQEGIVAGTVIAAGSLRPLEGAAITIAGADRQTRTDAGGRFRLENLAGPEVTLVVRQLGYRPVTQTVLVGEQNLRVALTKAAVELDAVVVTGTPGAVAVRAIGNAVAQIEVADVLQAAPVGDVQQLLSARVPGVVIMPYQGNVGTGGVTRVRGVASLSVPNEPLIYVDGFRVDNNSSAGPNLRAGPQVARINDLDPEDIARVEIIKGPAAATLYGTEASHGVIQIVTKQGTPGPPRLRVSVRQGANWFMNPADRLNWVYARTGGVLDSLHPYLAEEAAGRNIFQAGYLRTYAANLGGGSETARYYLSASLADEDGIVSYNWRRRISTRANLSLLPSATVRVQTSFGFVQNDMRLAQAAELWDLMTQLIWASPTGRDTPLRGFFRTTPEAAATIDSRSGNDRFFGGIQIEHRPLGWLAQHLTVGVDAGDETSSQLFPSDPNGANGPFGGLSLGQRTVDRRRATYGTFDYAASASFKPSERLSSTTSFGAQYYAKRFAAVQAVGEGFPVGQAEIGGAASTSASEQVMANKTVGLYTEQRFGWNGRAFLTAALRADDNSAFGENFDVVLYPKIHATWVVTEEPFWRLSPVNALKLRAAWGRAGQQPDAFAAVQSFVPATGPGDVPVLTPQNLGNPNLKPERGEELELGFDAGLWRDWLGITFTYFHQRTRDAIVPRVVPPSLGFPGAQLVNLGAITNWGVELSVNAHLVNGRSLSWDLGFGVSTNENRVDRLGGLPPTPSVGANQWFREGYPIGAYFFRKVVHAERNAGGTLVNIRCAGGPQQRDTTCAQAPEVYMGQPTPSWEGSVRTTVRLFGNLSLYGLVDFRGGHTILHNEISFAHTQARNSRAINDSSDAILLAYAQLAGQGVVLAGPTGLIKAGFAKLRELSATYTLPVAWALRMGASHATVTVAGRNLAILWAAQRAQFGWKILDPEVRYPQDVSGFARAHLPQYAQWVTTVRLTF